MIIFGLGNPGVRYRLTRHNVGYLFIERLAKKNNKRFRTHRGFKSAHFTINSLTLQLIKLNCYMNESGRAVHRITTAYNEPFLVVVDDINLALGRIRLRVKGSDGGHRGLKSIIEEIGQNNFPRLRIGIGRSQHDPVDHVLGRFKREEKKLLSTILDHGIKGLYIMIRKGISDAQNYINSIDLTRHE